MLVFGLKVAKLLLPKIAPYIVAILAVITAVGVAHHKGYVAAETKALAERLTAENEQLRVTIQKHRAAIEQDNVVAEANDARIAELEGKSNEVVKTVPAGNCLDADDTNRLLDLWDIWKDKR